MARYGPKPRYGPRSPVKVYWPADHRERYEREAAARGLSLNEYLIRTMAHVHGLIDAKALEGDEQLPLGA